MNVKSEHGRIAKRDTATVKLRYLKESVDRLYFNTSRRFSVERQYITNEPQLSDGSSPSQFDEELSTSYIGKMLLFGISYCDHLGNLQHQAQLCGAITGINEFTISVKLQNSDEIFTLPPFLNELEQAPPGEYRLRSTGEVVVNPDLLGLFQVFAAQTED